MIPILAVNDPEAARRFMAEQFEFAQPGDGSVSLGDQRILVVAARALPAGAIDLRLDHVALKTRDADQCHARLEARGARLSRGYTPDGPQDIPQFGEAGVRYVFFNGPEDWPMEFVARNGVPPDSVSAGHDHIGIRTRQIDVVAKRLASMGATDLADHQIPGNGGTINVRFQRLGDTVFELFDDPPPTEPQAGTGWIGLIEA